MLSVSRPAQGASTKDSKSVLIPAETQHDGRTWYYDPIFEGEVAYLEADLDQDSKNEVIIGYVATSEALIKSNNVPRVFLPPDKKGIASDTIASLVTDYVATPTQPVEPGEDPRIFSPPDRYRVFCKIFKWDNGAHAWKCVRTLLGLERLELLRVFKLQKDKPLALEIVSTRGDAYTNISVYQWRKGVYFLLDSMAVSEPVVINEHCRFKVFFPETRTFPIWIVSKDQWELKKSDPSDPLAQYYADGCRADSKRRDFQFRRLQYPGSDSLQTDKEPPFNDNVTKKDPSFKKDFLKKESWFEMNFIKSEPWFEKDFIKSEPWFEKDFIKREPLFKKDFIEKEAAPKEDHV